MSTDDDPGVTPPGGLVIDAALELLDRQLVDSDDALAGKVDDLELTPSEDDPHVLYVTAILSGPGALGPRLPGRLGRAWSALFDRLHPAEQPEPARISFGVVQSLGPRIRISLSRHHLGVNSFERWTQEHIISRIPGAGHAPE
jgi:hypothetical protein